jgi:hypothetical protein
MNFKTTTLFLLLFFSRGLFAVSTIYTIDISALTNDEQVAILALEGLANRVSPQIMIEPRSKGGFKGGGYKVADINVPHDGMIPIAPDVFAKYESLESVWMEFYTKSYGYTFQRVTFTELFNRFSATYKGVILYDGTNPNLGIPLATTIAGVKDGIPVTSTLLSKYTFLQKDTLENLVVRNFGSRFIAQKWLMENYLTLTNKDMAYSYWSKENNFFTIDIAVAKKLFTFDLLYTNEQVNKSGTGVTLTYDAAEAALLDSVFKHLHPGSIILGWGSSDEYIMQARCGNGGHAMICTNTTPNFSFHAAAPVTETSFIQKRQLTANDVTLENKIYITYSINEGDTYKSVGNLMEDGAWLHQKRGQIPFNWPINPKLLQLLPSMAKYFYGSMTNNDYFYSPTSGIGYFDASFSTPEMRTVYAQKGKEAITFTDMHYMDVWYNKFTGREQWIKDMGISGFTTWTSMQRTDFSSVIPWIESELYYSTNLKTNGMAQYIQEQTKNVTARPWFVHVYASDPSFAAAVMSKLDSTRFKAVAMDEFFLLANKAKLKLLGRYISKNQTLFDQIVIENQDDRFVDEFDALTRWDNKFCNYSVENGELTIETIGDNYFSLLVKGSLKFNLDKYPLLAVKINQFPLNNVPWKVKMSDGVNSLTLPGTSAYQVAGYPGIYCWSIPTITGWTGTKTSNLQLVFEGASNSQLLRNSMKYDWVRTYSAIDKLQADLSNAKITEVSPINFSVKVRNSIIEITSDEIISDTKLYSVNGIVCGSSNSNTISIKNLSKGFYILLINNKNAIKINL